MLTAVTQAFAMVFEPYTIMVMIGASLFGLFVGAIPGLTATMATVTNFWQHHQAGTLVAAPAP